MMIKKKKRASRVLTIDAGRNTGFALFDDGVLVESGLLKSKGISDEEFVNDMYFKFAELIIDTRPKLVKIEGVAMWSSSPTSVASASKGNLFTLAYLVGSYMAICYKHNIDYAIVYPREWKGNMSKDISHRRIKMVIGDSIKNEHILDAVGIGLAHYGKL